MAGEITLVAMHQCDVGTGKRESRRSPSRRGCRAPGTNFKEGDEMCLTERQDFCVELSVRLAIFFGLASIIMTAHDWIPFMLTYFDRWF